MDILFVCLMGLGTVFFGLICLIILCSLMSFIFQKVHKEKPPVAENSVVSEEIPNREETVAAISAAIAEDLGRDISAIRILSIKKM